jgi:hypothetical protein
MTTVTGHMLIVLKLRDIEWLRIKNRGKIVPEID